MVKKSHLTLFREGVYAGIDSLHSGQHPLALQRFQETRQTIEDYLEQSSDRQIQAYYPRYIHCLSSAAFGQGFSEGLIEYTSSCTTKNIKDLTKLAQYFCTATALPMSQTETHREIGRAYGNLGLEHEGLQILDNSRKKVIIACYYSNDFDN